MLKTQAAVDILWPRKIKRGKAKKGRGGKGRISRKGIKCGLEEKEGNRGRGEGRKPVEAASFHKRLEGKV